MTLTPAMFTALMALAAMVFVLIIVAVYAAFSLNRIAFLVIALLADTGGLSRGILCKKLAEGLPRRQYFLFEKFGSSVLKHLAQSNLIEENNQGVHITYRGMKASEDYKTFCNIYGS